jgi:hypothetical protein
MLGILDPASQAAVKFSNLGVNLDVVAALAGYSSTATRGILAGTQVSNQKSLTLLKLANDLEKLQERANPIPINFRRVAEIRKLLALAEENSLEVIVRHAHE